MKYQAFKKTSGAWINKSELVSGVKCIIVSETTNQPSNFTNKDGSPQTQDVCKVRIDGAKDVVNVNLNKPTIGALVDAFGDESIEWQNKPLTIETEKMKVAGKSVIALYLIPQGYEKVDDENGYTIIVKKGETLNSIIHDDAEYGL